MKKKLDEGLYNDPWEFVDDMWLMFNNAWLYNRKTSKVYKFCTKVSGHLLTVSQPSLVALASCHFLKQLYLHDINRNLRSYFHMLCTACFSNGQSAQPAYPNIITIVVPLHAVGLDTPKCSLIYSLQNLTDCDEIW